MGITPYSSLLIVIGAIREQELVSNLKMSPSPALDIFAFSVSTHINLQWFLARDNSPLLSHHLEQYMQTFLAVAIVGLLFVSSRWRLGILFNTCSQTSLLDNFKLPCQ